MAANFRKILILAIFSAIFSAGSAGREARAQDPALPSAAPVQGQSSVTDVPLRGPLTTPVSIGDAMNQTLVQSPRAASLRLQLGIARSNVVRATQMPNPSFIMDNGYRAEFTYRYGVSVPIEPPFKMALRIVAAKKEIKRVDYEIAKSLWALRGDIRRAYTEVLIGQERLETLKQMADLYQILYTTADKRCKAGDVARVDVYRADLACTQALINRDQAASEVLRAKQSLNVLLGRRHDLDIVLPRLDAIDGPAKNNVNEKLSYLPDLQSPLPPLEKLETTAYDHRLELKIVDQSIKAAQANLNVAYSNVVPTPAIGVGRSAVNGPAQTPGSFSANTFHGFFFQAFSEIPVFNFQQGDISKYKAITTQLKAERSTQKNIIEQDVVQAYQTVVLQRQKIHTYQEKALARSAEIAVMMQRSYQVGEKEITAALQAQQANAQVRNEYLDAIKAYELAYTDLEQSLGTTLY